MKTKTAIRRIVLAAAAAGLCIGAALAADTDQTTEPVDDSGLFYLRGDVGWSFLEWNGGPDDGALTAGAGVGVIWTDNLRSDVRLDWSGNYDMSITDLDSTTLLGNLYIDIPISLTLTPYAGAGLGWGWVDTDGAGSDSGPAYSLMAGATFDLSDSMALDTGYRFREIFIDDADFTDHSLTAGMRFKF